MLQRMHITIMGLGVVLAVGGQATAALVDIDLNNIASWADEGDSSNWVLTIVVPEDQQIIGFGYDLSLSTFGSSWLSEAVMGISDANDVTADFLITPGSGMNVPGTDVALSSGGIIPLSFLGEDPIALPSNAIRIEFFETFTDFDTQADAVWNGTLTLEVVTIPAPAALAVLGLPLLTSRRRRTHRENN